jgi:hypothetical protein
VNDRNESSIQSALNHLLTELGLDATSARLTRRRHLGSQRTNWLVLPSPARPQLLVPLASTAGPMIQSRLAQGQLAILRRNVARRVLSFPGLASLPIQRLQIDGDAVDELLTWFTEAKFSGPEVHHFGVMIGPPRANRKPVLRLFSADGRTVGYAKMGINALTNELVDQEAAALTAVSHLNLTEISIPTIRKHGSWRERRILLTSPVALTDDAANLRQPDELPIISTRSLFTHAVQLDIPIRVVLATAIIGTPSSEEISTLESLGSRLIKTIGDLCIPLGAAHGDWAPWNMAWNGNTLDVWDWERYETGLPQGFDAVHFEASKVRAGQIANSEQNFLRVLPRQLERCGINPQLTRPLLCAYLLKMGCRYARDLQQAHAPAVAERLRWMTALLTAQIGLIEGEDLS